MKLTEARVTNFKSIEDSGPVKIDGSRTVLVGQNESGKTAFLQALYKSRPVEQGVTYDLDSDYPRRNLIAYKRHHASDPDQVVSLKFALEPKDSEAINTHFDFEMVDQLELTLFYKYDGNFRTSLSLNEQPYISHLLDTNELSQETRAKASSATTLRQLIKLLDEADRNSADDEFFEWLNDAFSTKHQWDNLLSYSAWQDILKHRVPKFVYFDDYYLLPGKIALKDLKARQQGTKPLEEGDKVALSLLRMAEVDLEQLLQPTGYEAVKSQLEAISNSITDRVFEYWTQNTELDVVFDIREDPTDNPPYDTGPNLYIRINNRRHRVTVPFSQRSKGFIWFFSFIAWFESIQQEVGNDNLILLLDEPGLSLHALAQQDFLRYIDRLSETHQTIYTTHSPFMVRNDRLHQVRAVQDKVQIGTKVSDNLSDSDEATLFPLQASLGYSIAQNLFIAKRNLLVEGVSDLIYLQFFSHTLEELGREGLRSDIVIAPVGGLDKLATFVALIGANQLELAVVSDYAGRPDQRINSLVEERLIQRRNLLTFADFRNGAGDSKEPTDIEDLLTPAMYLGLFNSAYSDKLAGRKIRENDLQPGDRIVQRLSRYLNESGIEVRPSGGFNHYLVANHLAGHPVSPSKIAGKTLDRFEALFSKVNSLLSADG
jgi:energy-coupling factor transporter ATP-binding protein EcfA2